MVARHNFPAVVLGLLSVFALDVIALDSTEQIVFSAPAVSGEVPNASRGVLRSFSVAGEVEAGRMLSFAQTQRWDVWHVSPSRVDVYLPPHAPELSLDSFPPVLSFSDSPIAYTAPATSNASLSEPWDASTLTNATFYADYRPLDDIYSFMTQLANEHPDQISLVSLGHSGEGREMYALEISAPAAQSWSHEQKLRGRKREEGKAPPGFVITGAQHAREWVATSTALYIAHALVANGTQEYSLSPLLQHFSFYIVPVPNPDGYLYTWDHDRFWYKNRQELGHGAACTGLDMNRNWGYKWKATAGDELVRNKKKKPKRGAADPCSHWYPGSRPFQAPEVNNMANYFETLPRLRAFVDLRSYGQMLSTPYSYSCKKYPKDAEDQMEAISGAANAARRPHGTSFTTGQLCSTLYRAPGNVVDWMYSALGVKWSFAAHLRDTGTYGFNLPAEWIRPVAEETTQMVDYLARFIATKEKL